MTHQAKKLSEQELRIFRDRLQLPIPDAKLKDAPYYHPGPDSEELSTSATVAPRSVGRCRVAWSATSR